MGFVLIEAALATIIIGVAVVALLSVIGSATRANACNRDLTKAIFLAQEIREMLAPLPPQDPAGGWGAGPSETTLPTWDDIDDFRNRSFNPPINAQRQTLTGSGWSPWRQSISIEIVDPNYLAGHLTLPGWSTDMARVTVTIHKGSALVHRMSWLVALTPEEEGG